VVVEAKGFGVGEVIELEFKDLTAHLEENDGWDWMFDPDTPEKAIHIKNDQFETVTRVTFDAIEENNQVTILTSCMQGRNVTQITRVTGYFSRVSGWNKGKTAELRDRHRTGV